MEKSKGAAPTVNQYLMRTNSWQATVWNYLPRGDIKLQRWPRHRQTKLSAPLQNSSRDLLCDHVNIRKGILTVMNEHAHTYDFYTRIEEETQLGLSLSCQISNISDTVPVFSVVMELIA